VFLVLPGVEILDYAGPLQAFGEAKRYRIRTASVEERVVTSQGVTLANLEVLPSIAPDALVVVPGMPYKYTLGLNRNAVRWVARAHAAGATIASVCTGSFILGEAGLLDGRKCTTHWARIEELRQRFPRAEVLDDRLFIEDGPIMTSAGIASGIDMALSIVEKEHGPLLAAEIAREMVVYIRRDGAHDQTSVFLDYRTHINPAIHRVQDWIVRNPASAGSIEHLAGIAAMSPRNLTRVFRQATGISIKEYATRVRVELAKSLMQEPGTSLDAVARRAGFGGARQLRRVWSARFGVSPMSFRAAKTERNLGGGRGDAPTA
jgi:transcriptional regulator GlxA family with amidase domain